MFCMIHESFPLRSNSYQNVGWRLLHQSPKVWIDTLLHLGKAHEIVKGWSKFFFSILIYYITFPPPPFLHLKFESLLPKTYAYRSFAYVELYLSLATILRRFKFQLYDTNFERDVKVVRDNFLGEPHPKSKGVRVKIVSEVQ